MIIHIHDVNLHEVIASMGEQMGSPEVDCFCDETTLTIPRTLGRGYIKGINFQHGLGLLQLNFTLNTTVTMRYILSGSHPLRLIFCQEGSFMYKFEPDNKLYTIEALHSSFSTSTGKYDQYYIFPADTLIQVTVLEIDQQAYLPKIECDLHTVPSSLAAVLRDVDAMDPFLYHTQYSLALADSVYQIHENLLTGLSRKSFLEAKALEMFGLIVDMYTDDHRPDKRSILLRKADIKLIQEAERILTSDLKNTVTIPELAKQVGINTTKLKQGFKTVYNTTINRYLREKRMAEAASLLLSDSLSIRQIADQVGYSNPAHFANLFKERYGALPSEYAKHIRKNFVEV